MEGIVGNLAPASYIVIHEVHADAWGYQGQTQEFRYINGKPIGGLTPRSTRTRPRAAWSVSSNRVCQAWHRPSEVKVRAPGSRGAEG
ncbi:MAG: hypothetical protein ACHQ7N_08100 [Candidatus Methylomirabilales bacterium]